MLDGGTTAAGGLPTLPPAPLELPEDLEGIVDALKAAGATDVRVALYERKAGGFFHLHDFEGPEEVSVGAIRELFGGGTYQVHFRRAGKYIARPMVRVGGPRVAREGEDPAPPGPPARSADDPVVRLLERVLARLEDQPRGASPADPTALILGISKAMAEQQAATYTALAKLGRSEGPDMAAFGDVILKAIELGRDTNGGGGYDGVVKELGMPLLGMLSRLAGQPAPEMMPQGNPFGEVGGGPPPPPPPDAAPGGTASAAGNVPGWLTALRPVLPHLLHVAQMRGDVDYWSGAVLEHADDAQASWIAAELARREAFEAEFYQHVPQAVPFRDWFTDFWDALAEAMAEEDATE